MNGPNSCERGARVLTPPSYLPSLSLRNAHSSIREARDHWNVRESNCCSFGPLQMNVLTLLFLTWSGPQNNTRGYLLSGHLLMHLIWRYDSIQFSFYPTS